MSIPQISIVGRPNVGKSSIFNWLAGRRLAIVDDMAGVTRDRMTFLLQEKGRYFEIVDTGGIGINDVDELDEEIERTSPFWKCRYLLKPGITGWAQIKYQYASDLESSEEKLSYDLFYVKNASFFLDLEIILSTLRSIMKGSR